MSDWQLDPDVLPFVSYPRALHPVEFTYIERPVEKIALDPEIQDTLDLMNERLARVEALLDDTMEDEPN